MEPGIEREKQMDGLIEIQEEGLPAIADNSLLQVAEQAEKRIAAVVKIKQIALRVTNPNDWIDQGGKPYLYASGSEKIANLFNISWRIDEPVVETEPDGHYTYIFRGSFQIPGRSITAEGSRSSKDPFFKKYDWVDNEKVEKPISAIDRRDVRMAALTNLLGNGITRVLGIRNLSYADLEEAGITKEMIGAVDYGKKNKPPKPFKKPAKTPAKTSKEKTVETLVFDIEQKDGETDGRAWTRYGIIGEDKKTVYGTFSEAFVDLAVSAMKGGLTVKIVYEEGAKYNTVVNLEVLDPPEPPK